jgi:ABC-type cobalamin/Fe3+-siderophores transport system ATPase subunit
MYSSDVFAAEADKRPEYIDHILYRFPEDGLQVEYSRKGDGRDFHSVDQASAGQRAAAMLAFLLVHGNEPLVLDQPEDDLDNHLIYGLVVQQMRSNKLSRQLITFTHNPNIVVNGGAESIHVLDFNHQCHLKQTGSLQDQTMRREVYQVMERGEEAFERRYQCLGRDV